MGGSKPCGAGADNGHLLIPLVNLGHLQIFNIYLIGHKPLQGTDGNRGIHLGSPTGALTGMGTNAPNSARKGQSAQDNLHGLPVFTLFNQGHISVGIDIIGTSIGAGRAIALVDPVPPWDGLSIWLVSGLSQAHRLIELTGHAYRANLGTVATAGALIQINESGHLPDLRL